MNEDLEWQLTSLRPGDHVAQLYATADERCTAMVSFVTHGLARGERCLVVVDTLTRARVRETLSAAGVQVAAETARGALQIEGTSTTYLRGGAFEPDVVLGFLGEAARRAVADGFAGLRYLGDMMWSLRPEIASSPNAVIPFEARLADSIAANRSTVLCQYDRQRFDAAYLRNVLRTHPLVIVGDLLCRSQYFEPPNFVLGSVSDEARVEWMIRQLQTSAERDRTLERLVDRLESVGVVAARMTRESNLETLLALIAREASRLVGGATTGIYLLDSDGRTLLLHSAHSGEQQKGSPSPRRRIRLGSGVTGTAAQTQRVLVVNDYRASELATAWGLNQAHVGAVLAAPILSQSGPIGAISLSRTQEEAPFTDADRQLITLFADAAAIALENARLFEAVRDQERQLRELVGRLLLQEEEERRRIARDVHDGLAQLAAAVHRHLQAFSHFYHPRSAQAREDLQRAQALARETVREARRLVAGLRPAALDDLGLAAALRLELNQLGTEGWDVEYDVSLEPERLPVDVETALFRICQEALANVRKHTQPARVRVELAQRNGAVHLMIRDWGRGFDADARPKSAAGSEGVGLASMRERVALLGGKWTLHSLPGAGTTIEVDVPVPSPAMPATGHVATGHIATERGGG